MALVSWPLDKWADSSSWQMAPIPDERSSDYGVGPLVSRRRRARKKILHEVTFSKLMTGDEFVTLQAFFQNDLHHGVDKFLMPTWNGEEYAIATVQFKEPYTSSYIDVLLMRVSFSFIVHDFVVLDEGALYLFEFLGGPFILLFSDALHVEVHTHYPSCFPAPPSP